MLLLSRSHHEESVTDFLSKRTKNASKKGVNRWEGEQHSMVALNPQVLSLHLVGYRGIGAPVLLHQC